MDLHFLGLHFHNFREKYNLVTTSLNNLYGIISSFALAVKQFSVKKLFSKNIDIDIDIDILTDNGSLKSTFFEASALNVNDLLLLGIFDSLPFAWKRLINSYDRVPIISYNKVPI